MPGIDSGKFNGVKIIKIMAKLKNINSHFVESDYENVLLAFLEMKK